MSSELNTKIARAWQIDENGFFVIDLFDHDPSAPDVLFTETPCPSGVFRRPRFVGGEWVEGSPRTNDELLAREKSLKTAQIDSWRDTAIAAGVEFDFDGTLDVVQTRDERDYVNISGYTLKAMMLQTAGVTGPVLEFRAESNTNYNLTPLLMLALGNAVAEHRANAYQISWTLKDAVKNAQTMAELEAVTLPEQKP
jgi:hypothetical protein